MKTIIYFLSLIVFFVSVQAIADMPAYMKNGTISVTLQDGNTYTFSLNDYKVVPRIQEIETVQETEKVVYLPAEKQEEQNNRFTLHGGYGQTSGLNVESVSSNTTKIDLERGTVFGVTYSRKLNKYSVSGTVLSNQTFLLGIGYDF